MNKHIVAPDFCAFCAFCERVALAVLLLLSSLPALSQNTAIQNSKFKIQNYNYEGLKCRGEMPADIRKTVEQLYNEDKLRVRDYTGGKLTNRDQVKESAYYISLLLSSGRILYGDTITRTIERVADNLLKDYPELRRELRFYTVKSTDVNAFATGQGMVFVNMGLMAKIEDEAQLAFVLSHEIVHYQRKHALENVTRRRNRCDTNSWEGMYEFVRYHHRSRQMESEADSLGIELFYKNSGYDNKVTDGFFDVLQYGYLPFEDKPFDTTQFNSPYFRLSKGTFSDTVKSISARDDYNDLLSTHPNLRKRREATSRQLSGNHESSGSRYIVTTPSQFDYLRNVARFECIRIDLADAEYASAFYNSDVLLSQMPDNEFLLRARAQALYGAAKFRNYSAAANVSDFKDKEGEVQQAYHFMRRCRPAELNIVALREVWKTHRLLPDNELLTDMAADLAYDLSNRNNLKADVFAADGTQAALFADNDDTQQSSQSSNQSSTRRKRRQEQQKQYRYAFADIMMKDSGFQPFLQEWSEKSKLNSSTDDTKGTMLFNPTYFVYNSRDNELKFDKTIDRQNQLTDNVMVAGKRGGINMVDFSDQAMRDNGKTELYNDFLTVCEWYSEYGRTGGNVPMYFSSKQGMNKLKARYNVDNILLSQVVNAENIRKPESVWYLLGGAISVVLFPEALYYAVCQRENTQVRNHIVNIDNGISVAGEQSETNTGDSKAYVRSQTYAQILGDKTRNPGYLGRHLAVTGTCGLSFPGLGRSFDRPGVDDVAVRWGVGLEYAIRQQSSLALYADHSSTTFDIRNELVNTADAGITTVALTYRQYTGDYIAPLGNYWGVGAAYSKVSLESTREGYQFMYVEDKYNRFAIHLECGRNFIVFDRIMVNIGARYNITLANPFKVFDTSNTDYKKDAERSVNGNLFMYNILSLNLSLGILPF